MEITKNGLKKPAQDDFYNVDDFNNNTDIVEEHLENTDIHVSASEIGNIKEAEELTQIVNSDDNSKMWGKIKKLITDFLNHIKTTATGSVLGHVKLSDTYAAKVANGAAKDGLGASQNALYEAYNKLNTDLNNSNNLISQKAPTAHASTATVYGTGNASRYGHVKVSDSYISSSGNAANAIAASSLAVNTVYSNMLNRTNIYIKNITVVSFVIENSSGLNKHSYKDVTYSISKHGFTGKIYPVLMGSTWYNAYIQSYTLSNLVVRFLNNSDSSNHSLSAKILIINTN